MIEKIREYLNNQDHRKVIKFIAIIAIVLAIPLTVLISQQQQKIRQRASELPSTPPFPPPDSPPPGTTVSLYLSPNSNNITLGQTNEVILGLDGTNITGVDLTVNFNKDIVEITKFVPSEGFRSTLINTINNELGTFRYAAVETQRSWTGREVLGLLTLKGKAWAQAE